MTARSRAIRKAAGVAAKTSRDRRLSYRTICVLSERWRLCADDLQWILERYKAPKWRQVSFVGSTKAVLMRVIREKGARVRPDAQCALDLLPDRFRDWRRRELAKCGNLETPTTVGFRAELGKPGNEGPR